MTQPLRELKANNRNARRWGRKPESLAERFPNIRVGKPYVDCDSDLTPFAGKRRKLCQYAKEVSGIGGLEIKPLNAFLEYLEAGKPVRDEWFQRKSLAFRTTTSAISFCPLKMVSRIFSLS